MLKSFCFTGGMQMSTDYAICIVAAVLLTPVAIILGYVLIRYVAIIVGVIWTAVKSMKR